MGAQAEAHNFETGYMKEISTSSETRFLLQIVSKYSPESELVRDGMMISYITSKGVEEVYKRCNAHLPLVIRQFLRRAKAAKATIHFSY